MKTTITVHRIERHVQQVQIEVDADLPPSEQARQAIELASGGVGTEVGELEYHSTDQSPENWSVYDSEGKQIR